jgi:hypothetical protein
VLEPAEARQLLDSIDATTPSGLHLRDRALIALMVYSFAWVGAALPMKVEDVFVQNRLCCPHSRDLRQVCKPGRETRRCREQARAESIGRRSPRSG